MFPLRSEAGQNVKGVSRQGCVVLEGGFLLLRGTDVRQHLWGDAVRMGALSHSMEYQGFVPLCHRAVGRERGFLFFRGTAVR